MARGGITEAPPRGGGFSAPHASGGGPASTGGLHDEMPTTQRPPEHIPKLTLDGGQVPQVHVCPSVSHAAPVGGAAVGHGGGPASGGGGLHVLTTTSQVPPTQRASVVGRPRQSP